MDNGRLIEWLSNLSLPGRRSLRAWHDAARRFRGPRRASLANRRRKEEGTTTSMRQEGYLVGSMLGILALLMAFSFSMALDRYEERRHLVIQEANAIGTAYLRAQLLDEPYRTRLSRLLVDYTDNRIALGTGSIAASTVSSRSTTDCSPTFGRRVIAARDSANAHGITTRDADDIQRGHRSRHRAQSCPPGPRSCAGSLASLRVSYPDRSGARLCSGRTTEHGLAPWPCSCCCPCT